MSIRPNKRSTHSWARAVAILGAVCVAIWVSPPAPPALADLPPRPTPRPAAVPGAHIQLSIEFSQSSWEYWHDLWTVVQWEDAQGDWHDVEGWRGQLDRSYGQWGTKTWWVANKDFATGPFHWVVYNREGGTLSATSESFYLPSHSSETLQLTLGVAALP